MGRSNETFSKRDREKKKQKKREEKARKALERRTEAAGKTFDDMIAYVDEDGNLTDTPPDPTKKKKVFKAENIEISIPRQEHVELAPIRNGRVMFFNHDKGFGFIKDLETEAEHFVHVKGLIDEIEEGHMVIFELEQGMKGLNAVRVKRQ